MPLAGGLSVTFPDPPMLEWQWTGAAGMGVTGIAGALQEAGINRRALWGGLKRHGFGKRRGCNVDMLT